MRVIVYNINFDMHKLEGIQVDSNDFMRVDEVLNSLYLIYAMALAIS